MCLPSFCACFNPLSATPSGVHLTLWSSQRAEMTKATCKSLEHWWNAKEILIFSFKPGTKTAIIRSYGLCKFYFICLLPLCSCLSHVFILSLRFESLGSRGHKWSAGSALTQMFIPVVPRIVSSVCQNISHACDHSTLTEPSLATDYDLTVRFSFNSKRGFFLDQ